MLKYGFFDSYSGDRTYYAEDMNQIFEGVITDGIFAHVGDKLMTVADQRDNSWGVSVGTGRAHFNGIWIKNDESMYFPIDANTSPSSVRNDYILLIVDKRSSGRECKIIYQKNTSSYGGGASDLYVYVLAKIAVPVNRGTVTNADITNYINNDQAETPIPWVTAPLESIDISALIDEWTADIDAQIDAAINDYFDDLTVATKPEDIGGGIGTCFTGAAITSKITVIEGYKPAHGGRFSVRFLYNVPANATLNVSNGTTGTGTKPIWHKNAPITGSAIKAENLVTFIYDATTTSEYPTGRYLVAAIDAAEEGSGGPVNAVLYTEQTLTSEQKAQARANIGAGTYSKPSEGIPPDDMSQLARRIAYTSGCGYAWCSSLDEITAKIAQLSDYQLREDGIVIVGFTYPVNAGSTLNINSTYDIPLYYHGSPLSSGVIGAGDICVFVFDGNAYELIGFLSEASPNTAVSYGRQQSLSAAEQTQARTNIGAYSKPSGGIPETDFAGAVQTKLAPVSVDGNENLLNPTAVVSGYIAAAGQINSSDSYWTSDYIPVRAGDVIRVSVSGVAIPMAYIGEYTSQSQAGFVVRSASGSYYSHTVANNGYARVCVKTSACALDNVTSCMVTLNSTDLTFVVYGASTAHDGLMTVSQARQLADLVNADMDDLNDIARQARFEYIAYSGFGGYKGNSREFFAWVFPQNFGLIKCDVQPTSDGKLILCHDPGFTLDGSGKITTYDSTNYTAIHDMTYAAAMALTFANGEHVADIDYYLQLCKTHGKRPYITVRDEYASDIAAALVTSLTYYGYADNAIINSSTTATLTTVRAALPNITLCVFCNPFGSSLTSAYNYAAQTRDCIMSYYYNQGGHTWAEFIASADVIATIANCNQLGIRQCACIESDELHIAALIEMGFDYCHYMGARPIDNGGTNTVTLTGTTPTITEAQDNTIYDAGEVTSLTVTSVATGAAFALRFDSPAGTATSLTLPLSITMPSGFSVGVYGHCEINVDNRGYAAAMFWPFDD